MCRARQNNTRGWREWGTPAHATTKAPPAIIQRGVKIVAGEPTTNLLHAHTGGAQQPSDSMRTMNVKVDGTPCGRRGGTVSSNVTMPNDGRHIKRRSARTRENSSAYSNMA